MQRKRQEEEVAKENQRVRELARCSREVAYDVGLVMRLCLPSAHARHSEETESDCRITPTPGDWVHSRTEEVSASFSGGSVLADVSSHPHRDESNLPGTLSALAVLRADDDDRSQQHFISGVTLKGEEAGKKNEVVIILKSGDVHFEEAAILTHGSTPAVDDEKTRRLAIALFLSKDLDGESHGTPPEKRAAGEQPEAASAGSGGDEAGGDRPTNQREVGGKKRRR